jgi:DNA gyrase subunit B
MTQALANRVVDQFAARASDFDRASRWATDPTLFRAFEELLDPGHHEVLELCCGTGLLGGHLAQRGARVLGVDISADMLEIARTRLSDTRRADIHELPLPDGSSERIVLRQAWHFLDPRDVPARIFRVACPGARFVTGQIVPHGSEDADWLFRVHRAKQRDLAFLPTEESLSRDLQAAGWVLEARVELLLEEEMFAWLRRAPESEGRVDEVIRLVREAPEPYRSLHRVREDETGLYDTFRWILFSFRKPLEGPRVAPWLLDLLRCPACETSPLQEVDDLLRCTHCGARIPIDAGVPCFTA